MNLRIHTGLTSGLIFVWVIVSSMGCTFAPITTAVPKTATLAPSKELAPTNTPATPAPATPVPATPAPTATQASEPTPAPENKPTSLPRGTKKGQTAIDFTLATLQGESIQLDSLRGSIVLINFWAVWCGYCRVEMPDLQAAFEEYADQDFVILGIDVQESEKVIQPYVDQLGITFPILLDKQGTTTASYKIRGLPTSIFIDRQGVIQRVHLGPLTQKNIQDYLALMGVE